MNSSTISFRKANSKDTDGIVSFHNNSALKSWEDEFHGYRKSDGALYVATDGDTIIGTQGLIPYMMNVDGISTLASRSERTLVSPDYRGQGLFSRLYDCCKKFGKERDSLFVFGSTAVGKAFTKVGFRCETSFSLHLVLAVSAGNVCSFVKKGSSGSSFGLFDFIDTVRKKDKWRGLEYVKLLIAVTSIITRLLGRILPKPGYATIVVEDQPRQPDDVGTLFDRLRGNDHLIYLEQDAAFLEWHNRIAGPTKRYFAYRKGELVAFLFCNMEKEGTAHIIDLAADDYTAFQRLLDAVVFEAKQRGKGFVKVSLNYKCKPLRGLIPGLFSAGFVPVYRGGNEVLLPLSEDVGDSFHDIENFYITEIWHSLGREIG